MKKKEDFLYLGMIISLIVILAIFWILIIKNTSNRNVGFNNNSNSNISYSAAKTITKDTKINSGKFSSTKSDQNAILVSGDVSATLSGITVNKTGDSNGGDSTSFYGINSAIMVKSGATVIIKNADITTDAVGANGIFSYGGSATTDNMFADGTTVKVSNTKITTTKDGSGGIMTTGGGKMKATNLTITTSGISSAAIRTDRGGGKVEVNKGNYKTTGKGSPTIYSTADVTIRNAILTATTSEGAIIEGKNSITLDNVQLTATNNELNGQSTTYKNIFIYQSMSGDAAQGEAAFTSKNSTITTNKGDSIYVTNTSATINLENNVFINNDSEGNFLRIQKDSWGNEGSNGGNVKLNLNNLGVDGNIVVDSISKLSMNLVGSKYNGTINNSNEGEVNLVLDSNSSITLTGDSYIKSLTNADSSNSNINLNGHKLFINGVELMK